MSVAVVAFWCFFASCIGTLTGFGTGTILVPVLLLSFSLPETLIVAGVVHWFGNIWKIGLFWQGVNVRLVLYFGIPGLITTWIGAKSVNTISGEVFSQILGVLLLCYALYIIFDRHFKIPAHSITAVTAGTFSGFMCGIFGIGGAVHSAFLTAFNLPKAVYITTLGAIGLLIDSTRLIAYWMEGMRATSFALWHLGIFIVASFFGALVAKQIIDHIPQRYFRIMVMSFLLLVAIRMLWWPL